MAIIFERFSQDPSLKTPASWKILDRDMSKYDDMSNYQEAEECTEDNDECHVHENSKIPSHAFYAATVLSKKFDKIAHVWFRAMISMSPTESFQDFAKRTVSIAATFRVKTAVKKAWRDVGIKA